MRLPLLAAAALLLAGEARAQVDTPNGFSGSFGLSVRNSRYTVPLQRLGFGLNVGAAKSLGEHVALKGELGLHLFDGDEWAELDTGEGCSVDDTRCEETSSQEGLAIGSLHATVWVRPPQFDRLYFLAGAGTFALSRTSRTVKQSPAVIGGAGWVLTESEERAINLEIRYYQFPTEAGSLRALIPVVITVQF